MANICSFGLVHRVCALHGQMPTFWNSWSRRDGRPGNPSTTTWCWLRNSWRIQGDVDLPVCRHFTFILKRRSLLPLQARGGSGVWRHARQRRLPVWEGLQRPAETSEDHWRSPRGGWSCRYLTPWGFRLDIWGSLQSVFTLFLFLF